MNWSRSHINMTYIRNHTPEFIADFRVNWMHAKSFVSAYVGAHRHLHFVKSCVHVSTRVTLPRPMHCRFVYKLILGTLPLAMQLTVSRPMHIYSKCFLLDMSLFSSLYPLMLSCLCAWQLNIRVSVTTIRLNAYVVAVWRTTWLLRSLRVSKLHARNIHYLRACSLPLHQRYKHNLIPQRNYFVSPVCYSLRSHTFSLLTLIRGIAFAPTIVLAHVLVLRLLALALLRALVLWRPHICANVTICIRLLFCLSLRSYCQCFKSEWVFIKHFKYYSRPNVHVLCCSLSRHRIMAVFFNTGAPLSARPAHCPIYHTQHANNSWPTIQNRFVCITRKNVPKCGAKKTHAW